MPIVPNINVNEIIYFVCISCIRIHYISLLLRVIPVGLTFKVKLVLNINATKPLGNMKGVNSLSFFLISYIQNQDHIILTLNIC